MSSRHYASAFVVAVATAITVNHLSAQQSATHVNSVQVRIDGPADAGGRFVGTLSVQGFSAQGNVILVTGTMNGVLTGASGATRNLVTQLAMPLDITASLARQNTDAALVGSSCDVLHLELAATSINLLGSTIGLNPVGFDIARVVQTAVATTTGQSTTAATSVPVVTTSTQSGTQVGNNTATQSSSVAQTPLGSLLCSISGFRNSSTSDPAQLAQLLNQILALL